MIQLFTNYLDESCFKNKTLLPPPTLPPPPTPAPVIGSDTTYSTPKTTQQFSWLNNPETVNAVGRKRPPEAAAVAGVEDAVDGPLEPTAGRRLTTTGSPTKQTPLWTPTLRRRSTILSLTSSVASVRWAKRSASTHCFRCASKSSRAEEVEI